MYGFFIFLIYCNLKVRPHYVARQNATLVALPHSKSCSAYATNAIAST